MNYECWAHLPLNLPANIKPCVSLRDDNFGRAEFAWHNISNDAYGKLRIKSASSAESCDL